MRTINLYNLSDISIYRWIMVNAALAGLVLCFISCGDKVINTEKSSTVSNNNFILTLTISDDIVRLNDSVKLTATVERKVHKDSIDAFVSMKMMMDAVGGTIDGHSFSSSSNITVTMDSEVGSSFEALAIFYPSSSYSSSQGYYNYKENGHVSVFYLMACLVSFSN